MDYKKALKRTKLVFSVPRALKKQAKPVLNKNQIDHLAQRRQKEPTPLLDEINRFLQVFNRYPYTTNQRLSELDSILGMAYTTVYIVKSEFLVGSIPDPSRRTNAINTAVTTIEQLALVYKRILQEDYNSLFTTFVRRKKRILTCATYLLEFTQLEQEFYAMRYQRLPAPIWKDCNQIFFAIRDCLDIDAPQQLLRQKFTNKASKVETSIHKLYSNIQITGAMNIQDWECENMNLIDAYLNALDPADIIEDNEGDLLSEGQLITQRGQSQAPQRRRPKQTHKALIIDAKPLRHQLLDDAQQLQRLIKQQPAKQPQLLTHLDEQLAHKLVQQLANQFEFQRRHNERQYVMGGKRMRVYSTWKDCAQLIQDLANWDSTEVRQKRKFRDSLAERSAALGDSEEAVNESEWLLLDETNDGARLRTQETQFTAPIKIGQLVAYSVLDDVKSIQLAYVRRIIRNTEIEIDIGLSKFRSPAEWVGIQAPSLQKTNKAMGGILLGDEGQCQLLTAYKDLFNHTFKDLVLFQKAYRMPFEIEDVNATPPDFDILTITLNTQQAEHVDKHQQRLKQEKDAEIALEKARDDKAKADRLAQEAELRQQAKQRQDELIRREWKQGDVLVNLYEIQSLLGEGGMGRVYKAFHRAWRTELAIKRARPEFLAKAGGMASFEREAQAWIKLGLHQNIVSCYYVRALGDTPLLFAEYVDGDSLKGWIYQHKFTSLAQIIDVSIQFAWGLHQAHSHQLVHRDVKPANVMMTTTGIAKVTDFGLAQVVDEEVQDADTMTQAYCSPEQMERQPLTFATDVWSWGLSILEIFTGDLTWMFGAMAPNVLEGYLEEGGADANIPAMPKALSTLLMQCFDQRPEKRPNMSTIASTLQAIYKQETGHPYPRRQPITDTESIDSINNRAASLTDLEKFSEAQQLWQQALKTQPNHPESLYNTSLLAWRSGALTDDVLLRTLQSIPRSSNGSWMSDYMQALVHIERDDCEAAKPLLVKIQKTVDGRKEADNWLLTLQRRIDNKEYIGLNKAFIGEHVEPVCAISLSRNGKKAVSASFNGDIKIWDLEKERCVQNIQMHTAKIHTACISPNGEHGLSGGEDNTVKQWLTKNGQLEEVIPHTAAITCVSFSPNGEYGASASLDKTMQLWQVETRQRIATFAGHVGGVTGIAFSSDNKMLASSSSDGTLRIWTLDGHCQTIIEAYKKEATAIAWLANSPYILSGGQDHNIHLWDSRNKKCVRSFIGHQGAIIALDISNDGQQIVSTGSDKTMRIWDLQSGCCTRTFTDDEETLTVCITPDNQTVYSGDTSWALKRWTIRTTNALPPAPMILSKVVDSEASLEAAQTYNDAIQIAKQMLQAGNLTKAVRAIRKARAQQGFGYSQEAWNLWSKLYIHFPRYLFQGAEQHHAWVTKPSRISCIGVNISGQYVAAGNEHGHIQLWELKQKRCVHRLEGHQGPVNSTWFSADNRFIISAGFDKTIRVWDLAEKKPKGLILKGHEAPVTQAMLLRNNELLLSSSEDKRLRLWHRESQTCIHEFAGQNNFINSFAVSLDERYVLTGGGSVFGNPDNAVRLWEIATGKCIRTMEGHESWISSVCLTPNAQYAFSAGHDQTIKQWDLQTGNCIKTLTEHRAIVTSLALSYDGNYLLSGSKDNSVKLWHIETNRCLQTLHGHGQAVRAVAFSQDGRYVFTAGDDYHLLMWQLDWDLQERQAEKWDWSILPWVSSFLNKQMPYEHEFSSLNHTGANLITHLYHQSGQPIWDEKTLKRLMYSLGCAGFGWVSKNNLTEHLKGIAPEWDTVNLTAKTQVCPKCRTAHQYAPKCLECGSILAN